MKTEISIGQIAKGDIVRIICSGWEHHGIIKCLNKDDSLVIRDPRESYNHKVYHEDIVKVLREA